MAGALAATAAHWPPLIQAYRWLDTLTHILSNAAGRSAAEVKRDFGLTLRTIGLIKRHLGPLAAAMDRVLKVTRSYRSGLFHCYAPGGPPRTNNDLEHLFGQHRHHERRATGRKRGTVTTVLHGPIRVVALLATRLSIQRGADLAPQSIAQWQALRARIRRGFQLRAQGRRFRRDPEAYLRQVEADYLNRCLLL